MATEVGGCQSAGSDPTRRSRHSTGSTPCKEVPKQRNRLFKIAFALVPHSRCNNGIPGPKVRFPDSYWHSVTKASAPSNCPKHFIQHWQGNNSQNRRGVVCESNRYGEDRVANSEVRRAIEGIDDPSPFWPHSRYLVEALFGDHNMVRELPG